MATANGNTKTYTQSGYTFNWCVRVTYNVTSTTATAVNYSVTVQVYHINSDTSKRVGLSAGVKATLSIAGTQVKSYTSTGSKTLYAGTANAWTVITYTGSFSRTTAAQTKSLSASVTLANWGKGTSTYTNNRAFSVPALQSFQITFYGNGATYDEKAQAVPSEPLVTNTYYYNQATFATYGLPDYDNGGTWQLIKPNHTATGYWIVGSPSGATKIEENQTYATTQAFYQAATGNAWDGTANANAISMYAEWSKNAVQGQMKINGTWETGIFYLKQNGTWEIANQCFKKINGTWEEMS